MNWGKLVQNTCQKWNGFKRNMWRINIGVGSEEIITNPSNMCMN